jgi:hypothetical protein
MARLPFWLPIVSLALSSLAGAHDVRADSMYVAPEPVKPPNQDFWREVVAPHGDEIDMILMKAQQAWSYTSTCVYSDCDATGEAKAKLLDDAYGMLRYARRLDPTRADVLLLLGQVAEESGRATAAVEVLQAYVGQLAPDASVVPDVSMRLGRSDLRLNRFEDAIRQFRAGLSQSASYGPGAASAAYMAAALMNTGRMSDAIDLLAPNMAQMQQYSYYAEPMQAIMTLAVAYDRDEQITAAFNLLDSLQNQLTTSYGQYAQQGISGMLFVPAYDEHYYLGLFYESLGYFPEARTEWLHYAAAKDAPFRGRALDHADAIDELLAKKLADAQKAAREAEKAAKKAAKKGKKGGAGTTVAPPPSSPYPYPYP